MVAERDLLRPIADAVAPSSAEVAKAIEVIAAELSQGLRQTHALEEAVTKAFGVSQGFGQRYDAGQTATIDPSSPVIAHNRARMAARLALSKLAATGVATPAAWPGVINIQYQSGTSTYNTSGTLQVSVADVELSSAYRLTPGINPASALPLTSLDKWLIEARPLLTERTRRTLTEALASAQRGLYQASLTLLGAVVEDAWYIVGEAFRAQSTDLANDLDKGATAQVQRQVRDELAKVRSQRATAGELYSHACYLREVRNYGIHTGGDQQESLENAFTESATALIIIETQRHLVRLLKAATEAGASLPSGN